MAAFVEMKVRWCFPTLLCVICGIMLIPISAQTSQDFASAEFELANAPLQADLSLLSLEQLDALARQYSPSSVNAGIGRSAPQLAESNELEESPETQPNQANGSPYADCHDRQTRLYAPGASCEAQAVFAVFDRDGSGLVGALEFQKVLRVVIKDANFVSSEQAMAARDLDSNGVIDLIEFKQWWYQSATKANPVCEDCCGTVLCATRQFDWRGKFPTPEPTP